MLFSQVRSVLEKELVIRLKTLEIPTRIEMPLCCHELAVLAVLAVF